MQKSLEFQEFITYSSDLTRYKINLFLLPTSQGRKQGGGLGLRELEGGGPITGKVSAMIPRRNLYLLPQPPTLQI